MENTKKMLYSQKPGNNKFIVKSSKYKPEIEVRTNELKENQFMYAFPSYYNISEVLIEILQEFEILALKSYSEHFLDKIDLLLEKIGKFELKYSMQFREHIMMINSISKMSMH